MLSSALALPQKQNSPRGDLVPEPRKAKLLIRQDQSPNTTGMQPACLLLLEAVLLNNLGLPLPTNVTDLASEVPSFQI